MDLDKIPKLNEVDKFFQEDKVVLITEAVDKLTKKHVDYFPTGFKSFDNAIDGGVTEGDLNIIAGRTGEGKTAYGQTLTYYFNKLAIPTLWFSYEVALRHLWRKFQAMGMDNEYLQAYVPTKMTTGRIDWLEEKIKEGSLKYRTKIVFIDHLGFLLPRFSSPKDLGLNYSAYLGGICRELKTLAIATETVIFLLVHVRKSDGELGINDLANSAGIGQEADLVFILERQKTKTDNMFTSDQSVYTNETKIKIVKNRRTGETPVIMCKMENDLFIYAG